MDKVILECSKVTKFFIKNNKKFLILKGINLKVKENEIVVISGKSGEGKTVLLWLLSAIDKPSEGEILIDGINPEKLDSNSTSNLFREKIAIIFQDYNLIPTLTVFENVESALIHSRLNKNERKQKIVKMLEDIGLKDKMDYLPLELSIGQRQRVAIARSLVNNPRIIFADEPTGGLDNESAKSIIKLLCKLVHNKSSLIVTTHGIFPLDVGDHVFNLKDGKLEQVR